MKYIVTLFLLLGLVACESEKEKESRLLSERIKQRTEQMRRDNENFRRGMEMERMMQPQQQYQAPPPPQQQQRPLLVCPRCAGRGQVRSGTYTTSECSYCQGQGTVEAGRGPRGGFSGY